MKEIIKKSREEVTVSKIAEDIQSYGMSKYVKGKKDGLRWAGVERSKLTGDLEKCIDLIDSLIATLNSLERKITLKDLVDQCDAIPCCECSFVDNDDPFNPICRLEYKNEPIFLVELEETQNDN